MAKNYVHKVRIGKDQTTFYGKIANDTDIDEALKQLAEHREEFAEAQWKLGRLACGMEKMNAFQQLQAYRKYTQVLVKNFHVVYALSNYFAAQLEVLEQRASANNGKRWTKEEEEDVIDMICAGMTELEISIKTGRSIGAIHTKVSNLVGVQKERNIKGNFNGTINGEYVGGKLDGRIISERGSK